MIATDHAPHSAEEKSKGLKDSLNGIVGLETAFPVLYTYLVKKGVISLEKLIELMSINPAKRFGLPVGIEEGKTANVCVFDLDCEYNVEPDKFNSKGKSTPFENMKVFGKCVLNIVNGNKVWENQN
jgi:dihydroorotase